MLKNIAIIAVICILIQTTIQASTFTCHEEPVVCKKKFGTQFENLFKDLHWKDSRKLFSTYVEKATAIQSELSHDDPHYKSVEQSIDIVKQSLQKLSDDHIVHDNTKLAKAIQEGMNGLTWDFTGKPENLHVEPSIKLDGVRQACLHIIHDFSRSTGNLWSEMYSGLTHEDLTAFPEYEEVNKFLGYFTYGQDRPPKHSDFVKAAEILDEKFNLPYFDAFLKAQ